MDYVKDGVDGGGWLRNSFGITKASRRRDCDRMTYVDCCEVVEMDYVKDGGGGRRRATKFVRDYEGLAAVENIGFGALEG